MCHKKRRKTADLRFFLYSFVVLETCRIANVRFNRRFALKIKKRPIKKKLEKLLKALDNKMTTFL